MNPSENLRMEQLIRNVLDGMNAFLPAAERIPTDPSTILMGDGGHLDSLGIANFIVSLEEALEQGSGRSIPLSDQDLSDIFGANSVTIRSFAEYLTHRLQR